MSKLSRRKFLVYSARLSLAAATGTLAASIGGCGLFDSDEGIEGLTNDQYGPLDPRNPENFTRPLRLPTPGGEEMGILEVPSSSVQIAVRERNQELLANQLTKSLAYEVQSGGKAYFNPVLRVKQGTDVSARLLNGFSEPTIIHWHGMHVDWLNDGHPSYAIGKDASYDYQFAVQNRSGTYWYHPHPDMLTGKQIYSGLAGLLVVEDDDEVSLRQQLDLELGVTDIPLVLQDRTFAKDASLIYAPTSDDRFMGFVGELALVNQVVNPFLEVDSRVYRFRVLNASTARTYRLMVARGTTQLPFQLVGTDGGLLERPIQVQEVFLGPAERADLLVDFRSLNTGETVFLRSGRFDPMHMEMNMSPMPSSTPNMGMPGMDHGVAPSNQQTDDTGSRLGDGEEFNLLRLTVKNRVQFDLQIPSQVSLISPLNTAGAEPRIFTLSASGSQWLINGARFEMDSELFRTTTGATEVWEVRNAQMSMPHPMHLHGFLFQVVNRQDSPEQIRRLALDQAGRLATDLGWKDTVQIWPGETVRLAVRFQHNFQGDQVYTFHCHNAEHEDAGMMVNYRVVSAGAGSTTGGPAGPSTNEATPANVPEPAPSQVAPPGDGGHSGH